ncbi:uncharacterized protein RHOBADRAFT_50483 [Rhodotorula graminis WP1]|uniref:Pinin/SDK/MemA protein domain-containing protein n=1 Tax=Rhodotorula graminis (strain WP1) TaxID=578459 RepID=A0A194SBY8_RHOGW|nr:uncharacterized protein RHOBADRAFT_50483 [Rhodotorula graminis WP1]KPV77960.1 hypothetical protein RHOBADRAFT_50483 [Rhodotorula graminis WP1]
MAELDVAPSTSAAPTPPRPSTTESPSPPPPAPPKEPATDGMQTDDPSPAPRDPSPAPPAGDPATAGMSSTTSRRPASASPPRETDEQRADKKRKLEVLQNESRRRGARMFGVMMGTLQRAKREVNQVEQTDAGRKRAQLQGRLRDKLDAERREAMDKEHREREAKDLKLDILRREQELAHADSIFRTRQAAKLSSARFLCTTFTPPPPPPSSSSSSDLVPPPSNPRLPHALKVSDPRAPRPIYYLPYRLLPSQEDRLDDQLDAVRKARDQEQDAYDAARRDKVRELDDVRRRRQERDDEIERAARAERERRRREVEEREDKERAAAAEAQKAREGDGEKADRRSTSPPAAAATDGDRMEEDVKADGGSAPTSLKVNGAAADKVDGAQDEVKASAPASGEDVAMDGQEPAAGEAGDAPAGVVEPATEGMNGAAAETVDEAAPAAAAAAAAAPIPDDELEY